MSPTNNTIITGENIRCYSTSRCQRLSLMIVQIRGFTNITGFQKQLYGINEVVARTDELFHDGIYEMRCCIAHVECNTDYVTKTFEILSNFEDFFLKSFIIDLVYIVLSALFFYLLLQCILISGNYFVLLLKNQSRNVTISLSVEYQLRSIRTLMRKSNDVSDQFVKTAKRLLLRELMSYETLEHDDLSL